MLLVLWKVHVKGWSVERVYVSDVDGFAEWTNEGEGVSKWLMVVEASECRLVEGEGKNFLKQPCFSPTGFLR